MGGDWPTLLPSKFRRWSILTTSTRILRLVDELGCLPIRIDKKSDLAMIKCTLCQDNGWVCETHPGKPWDGPRACPCGAAGAPCPSYNQYDHETPPRMPEGFLVEIDKDSTRH
jgi:hypothetical protein